MFAEALQNSVTRAAVAANPYGYIAIVGVSRQETDRELLDLLLGRVCAADYTKLVINAQ